MTRLAKYALLAAAALPLPCCFTGVESTPRISASEVRKEVPAPTAEQQFLTGIAPQRPAEWAQGKAFIVTDPKITVIFTGSSAFDTIAAADTLRFEAMRPVTSFSGEAQTEIILGHGARQYAYRVNLSPDEIAARPSLDIPFTVEQSLVDSVRALLAGNTYHVVTPLWYSASTGRAVTGLRHVPVTVTDVRSGDIAFPLKVYFRPDVTDSSIAPGEYFMYMSVGSERTSTRNFHTLFAFADPRLRYQRITPEIWNLIIHSQVKEGMTRDECRLALGAPATTGQRPTTAGMVEFWQYSDGIYLLFEENILTRFRR